ncbi:hypothetical protein CH352_00120 [Leptospira hartskeerlii]|uniref:Uncharacterized protein n=1 Tax=Leptospira hartskeerlii TaxID=2023177 RepID=A0A2M9X981_9LEPT|nr:hypothetical protein [Leptospira hartskeerlii]PJZ24092.1 hypothetical protein CH357_17225 [Leptospira hartskeerlii]PJZ35086.1 hypothetical protein CH352_00120 [Leptospira hartskeerlii]
MVQKKKKKPTPKKKVVKRTKSSSAGAKNVHIPRDNDVKMSEMVDLAAEIFVQTLEISTKIPDRLRTKLIKQLKDAAKQALS